MKIIGPFHERLLAALLMIVTAGELAARQLPSASPAASPASTSAAAPVSNGFSGQALTLLQCERVAATRQPDLVSARALVKVAFETIKQSKSHFKPQVDLGASHTQATYNLNATPGLSPKLAKVIGSSESNQTSPYYFGGLSFSQEIYDFGRTHARISAAEAQWQAALRHLAREQQLVDLNVYNSYYAVLAAQQVVAVERAALVDQQRHLDQAQAFHNAGTRPRIDVTQEQVAVTNARFALAQAREQVAVARAELATAMGIPIAQAPAPLATAITPTANPPLTSLLALARQARPDVQQLRFESAAAEANVMYAKANLKPNFELTAYYSLRNMSFPLIYNWGFGEALGQMLFQGGYRHSQLRQAQAEAEFAQANLSSLRNATQQEVFSAYSDADVARQNIAVAKEAESEARENLNLASGRYHNGVGNVIELNDAELLMTRTAIQVVQAQYQYQLAQGRLQAAVGKLPR